MNQALAPTPAPLLARRLGRRLGPHHFAYLRAAAEGLDRAALALRYLGLEHGHERRSAHTELVDQVRDIARRNGERAWRLVGITIRIAPSGAQRPTLQAFVEAPWCNKAWAWPSSTRSRQRPWPGQRWWCGL
jgi:hypothetical protein